MVVDAALFLWSKAKSMFQKHQSGSSENPKYLQKMENPNKVNTLLKILIFFHFMIISISLCFSYFFYNCFSNTCLYILVTLALSLQWVYILDVVHKGLCWCGISSVDPALTAEVVLRLALVFESSAHMDEGKPSVCIILYHFVILQTCHNGTGYSVAPN